MGFLRTKLGLAAALVLLAIFAAAAFFLLRPKPVPVVEAPPPVPIVEVIGTSAGGRDITAYTYGTGAKKLLLVGGIHGGYEWNAVLLAYQVMDYLKANPGAIPSGVSVTVIPSLNPDGVFKVAGTEGRFTEADVSTSTATLAAGRFNADSVDLNRNFDCHWEPTATWQSRTVSAGTAAFSEPEAAALRDYVLKNRPDGALFWHSQANSIYTSDCGKGILPGTTALANAYARASAYPQAATFTAYPVTGDVTDWMASVGIPAISVELKTHATTEFDRNLAGVKALIDMFATPAKS